MTERGCLLDFVVMDSGFRQVGNVNNVFIKCQVYLQIRVRGSVWLDRDDYIEYPVQRFVMWATR